MAEGWLVGELIGGRWGLLGGWLGGGVATVTLEPRNQGPVGASGLFWWAEPTQLSRRNPLIHSGYQTLGLGTRDFQIFLLSLMAHKGPADIYIYIYLCIYIYIHIYYI
jgi:hypothetical protein